MQQRLFYTADQSKNHFFTYILGFQPSSGIMLVCEDSDNFLIDVFLDARYTSIPHTISQSELTQRLGKSVQLELHTRKSALPTLLEDHLKTDNHFQTQKLLIEPTLPVGVFTVLKDKGREIAVDDTHRQQQKRAVKTDFEAKKLDTANQKMEALRIWFAEQLDNFSGKTESQVAQLLYNKALELGASGPAFPTIVAFGKNSAIPHYQTGDTILTSGPLLVDMGWKFDGYCTDATRCFWIGEKTMSDQTENHYKEREKILSITKKAHAIGIKAAKPGVIVNDLVTQVRDYLRDEGYEQYFTHALGHGVGVEVHEFPRIVKDNDEILQENNYITIEPGVYLPGKFGVRWESLIRV